MPLFDAIEADVTAFFVSQGSVFDALIKSVLERVATVENRVQILRADVTTNLQTIRQQLVSANADNSGRTNSPAAVGDANVIAEAARLAAASALATMGANAATDRQESDERAMALARQLNTMLELVFCEHSTDSAVVDIKEKQARLVGLADVLRENERILSQLGESSLSDSRAGNATPFEKSGGDSDDGADDPDSNADPLSPAAVTSHDSEPVHRAVMEAIGEYGTPELTPIREEHEHRDASEIQSQDERGEEEAAVSADLASVDEHVNVNHPAEAGEGASIDSVGAVSESGDNREGVEELLERHPSVHRRPERGERQRSGSTGVQHVRHVNHHEERVTRKTSVYHAYQDLQLAEEARLRELRLRDDALLERVREMLEQSILTSSEQCQHQDDQRLQSQLQALVTDNERIRSETSELARELTEQSGHQRRAMEEMLSLHNQQLDELQKRLEHELEIVRHQHEEQQRHQEESAERGASRNEQLIEQQLQDATTQLVAMMEGHVQEFTAKMVALEVRLESEYVARAELDERQEQWQRMATSNCVFGATPETLAEIQRDLEALRSAKASPTTNNEVVADALDTALDQLAQTLEDALGIVYHGTDHDNVDESGGEGNCIAQYLPLSADGLRVMKTLRMQLGKVNDLAGRGQPTPVLSGGQQRAPTDEVDSGPGLRLLATALQRMELGTASLLDGCDAQFTRYQEALRSHQVAIGQLQQQLRQQTQSEMALRVRLALCPSQEDTQRLLQALEDKIAEVASDSASQTAATLAELRAKLTDLPSHELLLRLALDLNGKADRTEMERLRSMLEAQSTTQLPGPAASLTKSPLRCLSCDRTLFSAPTGSASRPGSLNSPNRPLVQFHNCQNCGYGSSPTYANRGGVLLEAQETDSGNVKHVPSVWSSPAFATSPAAPTAATGAASDSSNITDDLFAIAAAARQRRQREQQQQLPTRSSTMAQAQGKRASTAGARRAFINLDDGRNRIPLRRPLLADHIVYGPSIAPHSFRKKLATPGNPNDDRGARMTIVIPELRARDGQVIARATTSTALVRPFAELERGDDCLARQSQVPSQQQQPQRQHRSDRGNR